MVFGTLKFRNIPWNISVLQRCVRASDGIFYSNSPRSSVRWNIPWNISVLQRCVRASDGIFYSNSIQNGSYGMLKVEYSRNIPGNIDGSFGICKGEYGHSPTGI